MSCKRISVYITSYNQINYLKEAIESVLCQTLKPFEILIIDDCSIDGSRDMILSYHLNNPELIRYHFNNQNLGISKTRNIALGMLKGDYITFVDGDDLFESNKLEVEIMRIQKDKSIDMVYSNFINIDEQGNTISKWSHVSEFKNDAFERSLSFNWPKHTPFRSPLVNLNKWREIGSYDESLEVFEDLDMMLRLTNKMRTAYIGEVLSRYRRYERGLSSSNIENNLNSLLYIYNKNKNLLLSLPIHKRKKVTKIKNMFLSKMYLKAAKQAKQKPFGYGKAIDRVIEASKLHFNILFTKQAIELLNPFYNKKKMFRE